MRCLVDTVNETPEYLRLWYSTDGEGDQSLRQETAILERGDLSLKEWLEMERLVTLEVYANELRANRTAAPFLDKFPAHCGFSI